MALDLLYSWILAPLEHCRRGLLTDDVAASFLQFLMSPDDAADSRRSIKRPPLITSVSAPLLEQRLCSPTKKAIQSPFQYCKSPSTNASMLLAPQAPMLPFSPEPSLPTPWRRIPDCVRRRQGRQMRLCFPASATGTLGSHKAAFAWCGGGERRAFLHAECNVLAAGRPTPGCFRALHALQASNNQRKHVKLHALPIATHSSRN
jgi:hypothetical protein